MLLWLHEYVQMLSLETNQINNLILPCAKYSIIKRQKLIGKEKSILAIKDNLCRWVWLTNLELLRDDI